ncbi:MAG: hypothetical protein KAV00_04590 [Phycisphaerae bacterium]|nr:hypothetical protein [Phycisphaerae bacterium]
MALTDATFSGYIGQLLGKAEIASAFAMVRRRQVNVLREEEFPLLAVWVEGDAENDDGGSDGELQYEVEYAFLVAARLGDAESQDEVLGRLIKVLRDAVGAMQVANVEYHAGRWDTDNGAAEDEGDRVWAEFAVRVRYYRPRSDY